MATKDSCEKEFKPQLVVAIDFGTTGTGYAFQPRADFISNRLTIYENLQDSGDKLDYKIPSCLLVSPGKEDIWFGDEAEHQFAHLKPEDNPKEWFYFTNFKMQLYGKKKISGEMSLTSENGKTLPAAFVFSESIKWIKKHVLESLQIRDCRYVEQMTKWVLTVPAIWTDNAKILMRESAQKAGFKPQNLCIALEPEAAAVYYSVAEANPPNDPKRELDISIWTGPKTTNIIVDMGGGTVDITTIEVQTDGTMKQIHMAEGGPIGGSKVDEKFYRFMEDILGTSVWTKFKQEYTSVFYDFRKSFEKAKRDIQAKVRHSRVKDEFQIAIPNIVKKEFEEENKMKMNEVFETNDKTKGGKVQLVYGKLVFKGEILREIMRESLKEINDYVTKVAESVKSLGRRVHSVILVGGFASSKFMTTEIKAALEGQLGVTVKRPPQCHLAVLRGAVLYGHNESIIVSRVVRVTYGIGAVMPCLSSSSYPKDKMFPMDGQMYVNGVFVSHVKRGQEVRIDEWIQGQKYFPLEKDQNEIEIHVFSSENKDPKMIDDDECNFVGKFEIKLDDDQCSRRLKTPSIQISFMFGRTEITVKAKDTETENEVSQNLCLKE